MCEHSEVNSNRYFNKKAISPLGDSQNNEGKNMVNTLSKEVRHCNKKTDGLHPEHLEDLRKSGLSDETILESGIESVPPSEIQERLGFPISGLRSLYEIPYGVNGHSRYKVFYNEDSKVSDDGSEKPKYLCRKGSGNHLYIPPGVRTNLKNPSISLSITEGEKKSLKATQEGISCIAIPGLWNWSDGNKELISDFNQIALDGRTIYIIPDNDWLQPNRHGWQKNLKQAVHELAYKLIDKGAKVSWIELPLSENKVGLDDYLCNHSIEDFRKLPIHPLRKLTIQEEIDNTSKEVTFDDVKPILKRIASHSYESERALLINKLSKKTGISKADLQKDLKAFIEKENPHDATPDEQMEDNDKYFVDEEGYLCRRRHIKEGVLPMRLCNFEAWITEEIIEDNGVDTSHTYAIEGKVGSYPLPRIEVPASQFPSLNWLHKWGNRTIVEPGQAIKDYIRHAIQIRSLNTKTTTCYTHTGWRHIGDKWAYLTASGAIGIKNVSVKLSKEMQRYSLPLTVENETEAIRTSLSFLDIGERFITLPLWCLLYLSPLTTLLEPSPNFSGYLYAESGCFKTTIAALLLSHFGDFMNVASLPNFSDTANNLEKRGFTLKDTLQVLDDYHPDARKADAQQKEHLAQRMIRAYSNRTGRGRLNADTTDKGRYEPRGMLLITGEELVSLQSTLARVVVIEYAKGDIDKRKLTALQEKSDLLPQAMTSYISWVKEHIAEIRSTFKEKFIKLRDMASSEDTHKKLPEQVAFLQFTLDTVLSWMTDKGVISAKDATALSKEGWSIFSGLANKQGQRITQEDPIGKFIEIIQTLTVQEKIQFEHKSEHNTEVLGGSDGELIGYYDETYLYFLSTAMWHSIQKYCKDEGTHFPFNKTTLSKMLKGRKISTGNTSTVPEWIRGKTVRVLKVYRDRIFKTDTNGVVEPLS